MPTIQSELKTGLTFTESDTEVSAMITDSNLITSLVRESEGISASITFDLSQVHEGSIELRDISGNGFYSGIQGQGVGRLLMNLAIECLRGCYPPTTRIYGALSTKTDPAEGSPEAFECFLRRQEYFTNTGFVLTEPHSPTSAFEAQLRDLHTRSFVDGCVLVDDIPDNHVSLQLIRRDSHQGNHEIPEAFRQFLKTYQARDWTDIYQKHASTADENWEVVSNRLKKAKWIMSAVFLTGASCTVSAWYFSNWIGVGLSLLTILSAPVWSRLYLQLNKSYIESSAELSNQALLITEFLTDIRIIDEKLPGIFSRLACALDRHDGHLQSLRDHLDATTGRITLPTSISNKEDVLSALALISSCHDALRLAQTTLPSTTTPNSW